MSDHNLNRLAGIIAEIVTALDIDVEGCNLGPGPDICALGAEAVAALRARAGGRAEELIACLEAEIVKRDERVAELEAQRDAWKARSERRVADIQLLVERHAAELAALKAHPSDGVVLPERRIMDAQDSYAERSFDLGYNSALDEVARLNAALQAKP